MYASQQPMVVLRRVQLWIHSLCQSGTAASTYSTCSSLQHVFPAVLQITPSPVFSQNQSHWAPHRHGHGMSTDAKSAPAQPETPQQAASGPAPETPSTSKTSGQTFSIAPHLTDASNNAPLMSAQFPSSADDKFGVQKNWFTALYKQLNYMAKTGAVPTMKGRQRIVFEQVEHEFESLYDKHIRGKVLDEDSHRALLMTCLSVATYRTLNDEVEDTRVVRDVIRTNLGSVMIALLQPLHRAKLWIYSFLLREDMYKEAVNFLPALRKDMGSLCHGDVESGPDQTIMTIKSCAYHDILTQEDAPFLLTEFCCHHALLWLSEFRRHGVIVSMDQCKAWDDGCCQLRIARSGVVPQPATSAEPAQSPSTPTPTPTTPPQQQ